MQERRRIERLELELSGTAELVAAGDSDFTTAERVDVATKNVCADGAYLVTNKRPSPGASIQLHLSWPYGLREGDRRLEAMGNVLRVEPLPEQAYGFAVKFATVPSLIDS